MTKKEEKIEVTLSDLQMLREVAVLTSNTERTETSLNGIFDELRGINKNISSFQSNIPMDILKCKERLEGEIKEYMHKKFVTEAAFVLFESKLEKKMSKSTWIITGMILMASAFGWLVTHTTIFG